MRFLSGYIPPDRGGCGEVITIAALSIRLTDGYTCRVLWPLFSHGRRGEGWDSCCERMERATVSYFTAVLLAFDLDVEGGPFPSATRPSRSGFVRPDISTPRIEGRYRCHSRRWFDSTGIPRRQVVSGTQKFLSPGMKTRHLPSPPLLSPLAFYV